MPYYVRVGYFKNNLSGTTCKGYYIRRQGKKVIIKYGAINIIGAGGGKYYWGGPNLPQTKIHRFRSIKAAKEFAQWLRELKTEPIVKGNSKGGYSKLPPGVRIQPYRD